MGGKEDDGQQQEQTLTEGANMNCETKIPMPSNGEQNSSIAEQQHQKTSSVWCCLALPSTTRNKSQLRMSRKTPFRHDQQEQPTTDELRSDENSIVLDSDDKDLLERLKKTQHGEAKNGSEISHVKIQMVQNQLRDQFMDFYKPSEIAIGPIHAKPGKVSGKKKEIGPTHTGDGEDLGKKNEIGPTHTGDGKDLDKVELKYRLGKRFIEESVKNNADKSLKSRDDISPSHTGDGEDINHRLCDKYYAEKSLKLIKNSFGTREEQLKFFEEHVIINHNEGELYRMLFLDGCAVLQFIDSYVNNNIKSSDKISIAQADDIRHDLFLLENQIPFKVLVLLMSLSDRGVELAENVYRFISMNIMAPAIYYEGRLDQNISRLPDLPEDLFQEDNNVAVPVHLLDLLRSELLFDDYSKKSSPLASAPKISSHPSKLVRAPKEDAPKLPLSNYYKRSFRNIQDLKEVDIKFKADYSSGLRSVSFSNRLFFSPKLMLPPLIVDKSTKKKLLNLVAYEMCPDNSKQDYTVACYLRLLDSLIDCEQDVKDLRSAHILRNHLSSDEEVANLFNSVGSYLVPRDVYVAEKEKIQNHYKRKMASWTAQFRQEHFRNPTTFFAFLVGLVILAATCIQAIYTVHPKKD